MRQLRARYQSDIIADIERRVWNEAMQWFQEAFGGDYPALDDYQFPTYNLQAQVGDSDICGYYADSKVDGDCDWNPALGIGTLYGKAAQDFMERVQISELGREMRDTGTEQELNFGD
jgi:hypothetical protein